MSVTARHRLVGLDWPPSVNEASLPAQTELWAPVQDFEGRRVSMPFHWPARLSDLLVSSVFFKDV